MSWVRVEADDHEQDVLELRDQGIPLPRGMAITDLRFRADRCLFDGSLKRWLPYRALAAAWGWGEKRARLLVEDTIAWCDPTKLEAWLRLYQAAAGRKQGATRAQTGRNEGAKPNGQTPDIQESGRNEGADGAQAGLKKGHTRGVVTDHNHDHDHTLQERERATPLQPAVAVEPAKEAVPANGEAEQAIAEATALDIQRDQTLGINHRLQPADQRAIREAVRRGRTAEDVKLVGEWVAHSGHSEAVFLRDGHHRWRSVVNDRFEARLKLAQGWAERGRPSNEAATGPPNRASPGARASPEVGMRDRIEAFFRKHAVSDGYSLPPEPEHDAGV